MSQVENPWKKVHWESNKILEKVLTQREVERKISKKLSKNYRLQSDFGKVCKQSLKRFPKILASGNPDIKQRR